MRRRLKALALAGLTVAAVAAVGDNPAVAGVIYRFDGSVTGPSDGGPCEPGTCSVAGWIGVSTHAVDEGRVDDPTDVTGFDFTVVSPNLGSFSLELADLWTHPAAHSGSSACGTPQSCVDLVFGGGGDWLAGRSLQATHFVEDPISNSIEHTLTLLGTGGFWTGSVASDAFPTPSEGLRLAGSWLRVPEPGSLSLLLVGLAAAGLAARRGRRG